MKHTSLVSMGGLLKKSRTRWRFLAEKNIELKEGFQLLCLSIGKFKMSNKPLFHPNFDDSQLRNFDVSDAQREGKFP